jgi:hypothetical protein
MLRLHMQISALRRTSLNPAKPFNRRTQNLSIKIPMRLLSPQHLTDRVLHLLEAVEQR